MSVWKLLVATLVVGAGMMSSCEKEIEYKGPDADSKLVVNCIAVADSAITVQLERSRTFTTAQYGDVKITTGASVTLTDETAGVSYTVDQPNSSGNYVLPVVAQVDHYYTLSATHQTLGTATASMIIPSPVDILSIDTFSVEDQYGGTLIHAKIKWMDPSGRDDFYALTVAQTDSAVGYYPEVPVVTHDLWLDEEDQLVETMSDNILVFNDKTFNGQTKTLEVIWYKDYYSVPVDKLKFRLYSCNEPLYKYLVSTQKAMNSEEGFSEPVKVFSNIMNGYGIFGGSSMIERIF